MRMRDRLKWLALGAFGLLLCGQHNVNGLKVDLQSQSTPTCDAFHLGGRFLTNGGSSQGPLKWCFCTADGAASPTYAWCSLTVGTGGSAVVCAGGNTTTCP
jgi:hypothetical protein